MDIENQLYENVCPLRARPQYQLSAHIHSHKAGTESWYELALYFVPQRFCLQNQPLLVMRSRGEPFSTTLKVVTA